MQQTTWLTALHQPPAGLTELTALITQMDRCFGTGFAGLGPAHHATLAALERVFADTPLHAPLSQSCAALRRGECVEQHFTRLAAARAALHGTLFDLLQRYVRTALGRPAPEEAVVPAMPQPEARPAVTTWLAGARHWLTELALAGFERLGPDAVTPFLPTLQQIQTEPTLRRLAAALTGFVNELLQTQPSAADAIPLHRRADLWTRAMLAASQPPPDVQSIPVSGWLYPVGMDVRQHANVFSVVIYGMLSVGAGLRWVRTTLSAYKVDAISRNAAWLLLPDAAVLFEAAARRRTVQLTDAPLLPTGDLLWTGAAAAAGNKFKLFAELERWFAPDTAAAFTPALPAPADRHPIHIGEPIFLSDYAVGEADRMLNLNWGSTRSLRVAMERLGGGTELTAEVIAQASRIFGLLRFDNGHWAIQPLAVTVGNKIVVSGDSTAGVIKKPPKTSTVAILQERAGRLLRDHPGAKADSALF